MSRPRPFPFHQLLLATLAILSIQVLSVQASQPIEHTDEKEEAQQAGWANLWKQLKISTLWYLSYGFGERDGKPFNREHIDRGYLTLKFKPVQWFQPRVTLDTHQDDQGDWKVRLKYMYGKFVVPMETSAITEPNIEFGLVHGPWFDFEEHINNYRMQGTMFIERNGVLNSADAGFTVGGLLGKKLSKEYREKVSAKYPGSYGSFAFGLYNGGGYHAVENNQNKVFASRVSLRPLGYWLPNLQLSHFLIFGKGNIQAEPGWLLNAFMGSFEHEYFVITAQYATGKGNQKGNQVDESGEALELQGFSAFAEIRLPRFYSRLIGRYDWFEWAQAATNRIIVGYAFYFLKHSFVLLDLDWVMHADDNKPDDWQVKLTMQVHFP